MLELQLNKVEEAIEVKKYIPLVETSGENGTKKILVKNLNIEYIRKEKDIVKDLMNLDAIDFDLDEDLEKLEY